MRRLLALLIGFSCLTAAIRADEPRSPDGVPIKDLGGLQIFRQGDQTVFSLGGGLFRRRVKVITATPDGPVVTRFTLPSAFQSPLSPALPEAAPALIRVAIPDPSGVLYIEGELVSCRGTARQMESPILAPGKSYPLHVRAGWLNGNTFLIEDRLLPIRAGESYDLTFDGSRALAVPMPSK